MTRPEFDTQLGRLVVLKGMPGDSDPYWDALQDIPLDVFTGAMEHAIRTRVWWPVPAELRADCDVVKARVPLEPAYPRVEPLPEARVFEIPNPFGGPSIRITITREWRHDCDTCDDTGWSAHQCPETACGRRNEHGPHAFVERCFCVDWNPTIKRKKATVLKYSQPPEKVGA